jgi:hypothetical protein
MKNNFQFYISHDEILCILNEVLSAGAVHVYLLRVSPEYGAVEAAPDQRYDLSQWEFAVFSQCSRALDTKEAYLAYTKSNHGDLTLHIGDETETELWESCIGMTADRPMPLVWRKLVDRLRNSCRKGAYVVTPRNVRKYYPQIQYSMGTRKAYQKGKIIRPAVGWNRVELVSDQETSDR